MNLSLRTCYEILVDLPVAERAAWLGTQGLSVDQHQLLLQMLDGAGRNEGADFLTSAPDRLQRLQLAAAPAIDAAIWVGHLIGGFRLLRLIGQGGMGTIFLAVREGADFDQQVAIKLLRRGLVSELDQRLFRRERKALAALSHPNIARLIDGGVTESGLPYLAMEYVDGISIKHYCSAHALSVTARLRLISTVCRAVDAAHRALIVHRDIKPSNILVTADGEVKLLDFGIAKLLESDEAETATGLAALTPDYAAPEQFGGGAITTATDVYALGVMLHELLTGVLPGELPARRPSSRIAALSPAADAPPLSSSVLRQLLRGDLDNIVLKSLELEPARRYASAGAMGEDIEQFLAGRPVAAHPPSRWYRTRKFVARHRGGIAVVAVLVLAVLSSLVFALWQMKLAHEEAERANAASGFMVEILRATAPTRASADMPSVPELVYQASSQLMQGLDGQPEIRVDLQNILGNVLRNMNDVSHSETLLLDAEQASAAFPADSALRIENQIELVRTMMRKGDFSASATRLDPLLRLAPAQLPATLPPASLRKLAMVLAINRGETARALAMGDTMIGVYDADCRRGLRCMEAAMALHDYASVLVGAGQVARARPLLAQSLSAKESLGVPLISVIETLTMLSSTDMYLGDLESALQWLDRAEQDNDSLGLQRQRISPLRQRGELALAQEDAVSAIESLEKLQKIQVEREESACARLETVLLLAQSRALLAPSAGLAEGRAAMELARECGPQPRSLRAELAALVVARGEATSAPSPSSKAMVDAVASVLNQHKGAGPGPVMQYLAEAMRLSHALRQTARTQALAAELIAFLDRIGAHSNAPLRLEAEILQSGTDAALPSSAIADRLVSIAHWPVGRRLGLMLEQLRAQAIDDATGRSAGNDTSRAPSSPQR